jgi:hypothetical protein
METRRKVNDICSECREPTLQEYRNRDTGKITMRCDTCDYWFRIGPYPVPRPRSKKLGFLSGLLERL